MAKSPPSPFLGTQCCFPLTNYLSSPLQTHSFAQTPDCKCNLFKGHVMRCANGKLLDLKQCSAFIIIVTRYSTPACCMFSSSCCISHDARPWSHLVTWWHCDDLRFIKADGNIVIYARAHAHIARHHSSNINGNIVEIFLPVLQYWPDIIVEGRAAIAWHHSTDPHKRLSLSNNRFRSMTKRLRKCWSFTLRTKAQGNDCGSDGKLKDLEIFRKAGSQQWPSTIFMCAKSFTFPRNFPRR